LDWSPPEGSFVPTEPLIAVIDDDDALRTALVDSLESLGFRVCGFDSAERFVAAGDVKIFDCLVADIHMPGMSGIELMQSLAETGNRPPVIMITARADATIEQRAVSSGAICVLKKPFTTATLLNRLQQALGT
jgi:FixJ family two-component response regulator